MLSKAVSVYTNSGTFTLMLEENPKRDAVTDIIPHSKNLCVEHACSDIILTNTNDPMDRIVLISAAYSRLNKWSDTLSYRLTWDNTYSGTLINQSKTSDEVVEKLTNADISQLKFGAFTRDSPIIATLMRLFKYEGGSRTRNKLRIKTRRSRRFYLK